MAFQKELWRRLRYLTSRARFHSDLSDEMQFHLGCRAAELEEIGVTPEEALARALREFGSPIRVAEDTHGVWQLRWLEDLGAILSALISGLMPALKAVRKDVNDALKNGQRQTERFWGFA